MHDERSAAVYSAQCMVRDEGGRSVHVMVGRLDIDGRHRRIMRKKCYEGCLILIDKLRL